MLKPTDDIVTVAVLRGDVFGLSHDDEMPPGTQEGVIRVCDGEWRRRPDNRWQFWQHDDKED
jgi:hypothetical protein